MCNIYMRDFSLNDTDFLAENHVETYLHYIYIYIVNIIFKSHHIKNK